MKQMASSSWNFLFLGGGGGGGMLNTGIDSDRPDRGPDNLKVVSTLSLPVFHDRPDRPNGPQFYPRIAIAPIV